MKRRIFQVMKNIIREEWACDNESKLKLCKSANPNSRWRRQRRQKKKKRGPTLFYLLFFSPNFGLTCHSKKEKH